MGFSWVYEGSAWLFGDDVGIDGDLMPLKFALMRETDPEILRRHLFAGIDPDFPQKCRPGDIVVGGRRFAQGNPHIQGLLGLRGAGLALVAESIPSASLRNSVNAGVPTLPACAGIRNHVRTGERLRVDFSTGEVRNLSSGWIASYEPLNRQLRDIVAIGGWREHFRNRLAQNDGP